MKKVKKHFMQIAINEAYKGIANSDGGPFGAIIVKDNKIIAKAHNKVLQNNDATCHAEVEAIRIASKKLGSFSLKGCTIYTTAEPCSMCYSAINWAKIKKIVFSISNKEIAMLGFNEAGLFKKDKSKFIKLQITRGILKNKVKKLIKRWKDNDGKLY